MQRNPYASEGDLWEDVTEEYYVLRWEKKEKKKLQLLAHFLKPCKISTNTE